MKTTKTTTRKQNKSQNDIVIIPSPSWSSRNNILINNNWIDIPTPESSSKVSPVILATVCSNLLYFGFVLSETGLKRLSSCSDSQVKEWWANLEPVLKKITFEDKKIGDFVVYKNFPQEVLNMSEAEYWMKQICMYLGCPNEWFTQEAEPREYMLEKVTLKVLHPSNENTVKAILNSLFGLPSRWTQDQYSWVSYLVVNESLGIDTSKIVFKENLARVLGLCISNPNIKVNLTSATDVLRLAVVLSDGDVTFTTNTKFKKFSRSYRKFFLKLLQGCGHLEEDIARDKNRWEKFLHHLHPWDYNNTCPDVVIAFDKLYKNKVFSFNSKVERLIKEGNQKALTLLAQRPGDFTRRLAQCMAVFGKKSVIPAYTKVLPNLKVVQLLKIKKYLETAHARQCRTFAPKGNWAKLQIVENNLVSFPVNELIDSIDKNLSSKLIKALDGKKINLDPKTEWVKIQTNDSELAPYGRGTVFPIPENVKFIRSASYWSKAGNHYNLWFDNSWNFFDSNWTSMGACCWNLNKYVDAAIYAGDPTSSKDMQGRAAEMIDLYIDKLVNLGVRYAVWGVLCYNRVPFNDATEVVAALQWGEEAQKGKLFEPSRCQLAFNLKGKNLVKYIAYIDLEKRQLVYIDANLKGEVRSAGANGSILSQQMSAFTEYLVTLPSVYDLFNNAKKDRKGIPVLYSDECFDISSKEAYIFRMQNEKNKIEKVLDLNKVLNYN